MPAPNPFRRRSAALPVVMMVAIVTPPRTARGEPVPEIESVAVLDAVPLPADAPQGFLLGGLSDLAIASDSGSIGFWAVTDRGPNGSVVEPATGDAPPKTRRTLPIPGFVPLLVRLETVGDGDPGTLVAKETIPLVAASGSPTSGRPVAADLRAKPIVDPRTLLPVTPDPDGFDTEGIARTAEGGFWIAEEYVPSLAEVDASGRLLRRLVPRGVTIPGASCPVEDSLPADLVGRRDNRGFESLALSPDGTRLVAFLQSPLADPPAPAGTTEPLPPTVEVPLVVVDPRTGRTLAEHLYPMGDGDPDTCRWCVAAADGKVSAVAFDAAGSLLVLEQSDTDSRIYSVDLPAATAGRRTILAKTLVADLAPLAAAFQGHVVPGSDAPPERLSELKFEGMAVLGGNRVALVNDNDFDIAADGGGPAAPPSRRTCLWILRLPQATR